MVPEGFPFEGAPTPANFDPWSSRNMRLSPDGGVTPAPRTEADPAAIDAAYTSGMLFDGDIDIPVIDWRHYLEDELDMHHSHQSFATRSRMLDADGDASNQVIWFTDARPTVAFDQTADGLRRDRRVDGEHRGQPEPERGRQQAGGARSTPASTPPAT